MSLDTFRESLPASWLPLAEPFISTPQAQALAEFVAMESRTQTVYPPTVQRFRALQALAPEDVKVVILGQDPYHGPKQAMGLSFSVPRGEAIPPSLQNMYKELMADVGFLPPNHGDLTAWAEQGILLLNSVLSVRAGAAGSHAKRGWESLTDCLLRNLAAQQHHIVFLLWGSYAQRKAEFIDAERHLLLHAPHPSPLSAYRGFIGCRHFSLANAYLHATGQSTIDWQLSNEP
ncbi:uracil-DNA glycosylase [Salinispirillum marinum]|uniref:Uracil-DNA glycosylase n=2 Tax=Saccharospirillaceae TaxID=255527 RepID=A0ABV8BCB0_9GAMM